jgi:PiT family inorganic phosphate transporter
LFESSSSESEALLLSLLVAAALAHAFLNGFHGSAALVATLISSRAASPRFALAFTAATALAGPLLLGTAVANTVGRELILPEALSLPVLMSALAAAVGWSLFTWLAGIPSSASQALIGGLLGAATMAAGPGVVQRPGLLKVLIGLFISPPLGLMAGLLVMSVTLALAQYATPKANVWFRQWQYYTTLGLALTVSSNDVQKVMGVIVLGLLLSGRQTAFSVPAWVTVLSAAAFSLGMLSGGYRLIRTLGGRIFRIRPIHGFVAQFAAALVTLVASLTGLPVSSTQVISTAIFGVGSAERLTRVRWQVAGDMITAWVLTLPMTGALAGLIVWLLKGSGL